MDTAFSGFTRLERHFLEQIAASLEKAPFKLVANLRQKRRPDFSLVARRGSQAQTVTVQVHGVRPVRYHLVTENTDLGRKLKVFFSELLGAANLLTQDLDDEISLVYHVHYPDELVKKLGG